MSDDHKPIIKTMAAGKKVESECCPNTVLYPCANRANLAASFSDARLTFHQLSRPLS